MEQLLNNHELLQLCSFMQEKKRNLLMCSGEPFSRSSWEVKIPVFSPFLDTANIQ